jgi:hypothetical protein
MPKGEAGKLEGGLTMHKNMRAAMLVAVAGVVALVVGDVSAAQKVVGHKRTAVHPRGTVAQKGAVIKAKPGTRAPNVVGTLGYDNDIPASRFGAVNVPVGNNFNVGFIDPHSIAAVSFRLAGCFTTPYVGARAFVQDINPTAMTVMGLATFSAGAGPGANCNGASVYTGMLPAPVVGHSGPFFAGVLNTPFAGCSGNTGVGGTCEGVALSAGTMDPGQGFHAVVVNGGMYTAIAPARNAIFRATGDNLPVELMGLSVE